MKVSELFNDNAERRTEDRRHYAAKVNDNVLKTEFRDEMFYQRCYFDFLSRTVSMLVYSSNNDRTLTFDEVDPEVLQIHRQMLIDLGGNPRPLPASHAKPSLRPPAKGYGPNL